MPARRGSAVHIFAGPSFNVRLRARGEGTFQGETSEQDISEDIEPFEIGLVVGAGVEIGRLILDGRYAWGLSDLDKDDTDDVIVKNRVLSLTAGIRF